MFGNKTWADLKSFSSTGINLLELVQVFLFPLGIFLQFITEIVIYAMPFQGVIPDHTEGTKCYTFVNIENILNSEKYHSPKF